MNIFIYKASQSDIRLIEIHCSHNPHTHEITDRKNTDIQIIKFSYDMNLNVLAHFSRTACICSLPSVLMWIGERGRYKL